MFPPSRCLVVVCCPQLREVAETLQQQQSRLLEKLRMHDGEEEAFRETIDKLRAEVQARDAELAEFKSLVRVHASACTSAANRCECPLLGTDSCPSLLRRAPVQVPKHLQGDAASGATIAEAVRVVAFVDRAI